MTMTTKLMLQLVLLTLTATETLSQSSDVIEDIQTTFSSRGDHNALLMTLAVLCGAGLVGIIGALIHVVRPLPLFTLRTVASNDPEQYAGPALKLFDRIEEFH